MLMAQTNPCNSLGEVHDTVQNAVTGLGGSGWVYVPPGTWSEALTISDNYVMLFGAGWSSIIDGGTTGHAIDVSGDYCVIKDLQVKTDVAGGNNYSGIFNNGGNGFCRILNVFVNGSDYWALDIQDPDALIANCYLYDADENSISIAAARCIVTGSYIDTAGWIGVSITATGDDSIVIGSIITTTASDGITINADGENCVIDGNRLVTEVITDNSGTSTVGDNDTT